jgi:hypothetical protein
MEFKYKAVIGPTLDTYKEHGMEFTADEELFNGLLIIEAPDEETADIIRMTYSDIRMWEKVVSE